MKKVIFNLIVLISLVSNSLGVAESLATEEPTGLYCCTCLLLQDHPRKEPIYSNNVIEVDPGEDPGAVCSSPRPGFLKCYLRPNQFCAPQFEQWFGSVLD
ncbi:MAG: hypothetical protein AB7F66_06710 [Bacteriovoracia bacterium]